VSAINQVSLNEPVNDSELFFDGKFICFNTFVIVNTPNSQITELFTSADYFLLLKKQPKWATFNA